MTELQKIPPGTQPLTHQVAGHVHGKGKTKIGFLQTEDGAILKPLQGPPRGERERSFYECVFDPKSTDSTLLALRPLLPHYFGTFESPDVPDVKYLKLEDVAYKFHKPCIADLKMGARTYDPEAKADKIEREKAKYLPLHITCFQIRGMRVYTNKTNSFQLYEKSYLRSLDEEDILSDGLAIFFGVEEGLRKDVVCEVLMKVNQIKKWMENQTRFLFYACSLLIVYEGDRTTHKPIKESSQKSGTSGNGAGNLTKRFGTLASQGNNVANILTDCGLNTHDDCDKQHDVKPLVDVRLIDFAHVFDTKERDQNQLDALESVLKYLKRLLE